MLESKKCYHWIQGTNVEDKMKEILSDLPSYLKQDSNRYPYSSLLTIAINRDKYRSKLNLDVAYEAYQKHVDHMYNQGLRMLENQNPNDTGLNSDI